jgi:hypothetical protein
MDPLKSSILDVLDILQNNDDFTRHLLKVCLKMWGKNGKIMFRTDDFSNENVRCIMVGRDREDITIADLKIFLLKLHEAFPTGYEFKRIVQTVVNRQTVWEPRKRSVYELELTHKKD